MDSRTEQIIPDNIERLAQIAGTKIAHMVREAYPQINDATTALIEQQQSEKQDGDKPKEPVLSLSIGVKWGLDSNNVSVVLNVSVKHKFTQETRIDPDNPDQLQMFPAGTRLLAAEGPGDFGGRDE